MTSQVQVHCVLLHGYIIDTRLTYSLPLVDTVDHEFYWKQLFFSLVVTGALTLSGQSTLL